MASTKESNLLSSGISKFNTSINEKTKGKSVSSKSNKTALEKS